MSIKLHKKKYKVVGKNVYLLGPNVSLLVHDWVIKRCIFNKKMCQHTRRIV